MHVFLLGTENFVGGGVAAIVVVICGKIEKLSDQNKIWCGTRYGPCDYDSGDKKAKRQKSKRQKGKKTKRQKYKKTDKKYKKTNKKTRDKNRGPEGPPHPPQELEQGGHRPPKFYFCFKYNLVYSYLCKVTIEENTAEIRQGPSITCL